MSVLRYGPPRARPDRVAGSAARQPRGRAESVAGIAGPAWIVQPAQGDRRPVPEVCQKRCLAMPHTALCRSGPPQPLSCDVVVRRRGAAWVRVVSALLHTGRDHAPSIGTLVGDLEPPAAFRLRPANVELWLQFLKALDGPRRGCSSRSGCRGGRRPVPAGRRPGSRLRPYCCQRRQGSGMDEGLGTAVSGWTRVTSSARNRFGWVKAAKWPASLISASPLVGASTSAK